MFDEILRALDPDLAMGSAKGVVQPIHPSQALPSVFPTSALALASVSAAAVQLQALGAEIGCDPGTLSVDPALCGLWFGDSVTPEGWHPPGKWDAIAGDYASVDGWIRLHTNYQNHRAAALSVLGCEAEREQVTACIAKWRAADLETAIVEAGGCAAQMMTIDEWSEHPQGRAVALEPLIHWHDSEPEMATNTSKTAYWPANCDTSSGRGPACQRPLAGLKVLDLTRVLAGPAATRFLAAFGAEVLRIDPLDWHETMPTLEMSVGKLRATLDLKTSDGKERLGELMRQADVLVHGYRPQALAALGFDADFRRQLNPHLIDVSLCAYGWTGPWADRRGFDSLVQMSSGIAAHGSKVTASEVPHPLPVQALDHATGYLMAASVLRGLRRRVSGGVSVSARLSLARTAQLLRTQAADSLSGSLSVASAEQFLDGFEQTDWGQVKRLCAPIQFSDCEMGWDIPAGELRIHAAAWRC